MKSRTMSAFFMGIFLALSLTAQGAVVLNDNMKDFDPLNSDGSGGKGNWINFPLGTPYTTYHYGWKNGIMTVNRTASDDITIAPVTENVFGYVGTMIEKSALSANPLTSPTPDETVGYEVILSYQRSGDENSPYGPAGIGAVDSTKPYDGLRLGYSGMAFINLQTGATICFFISNEGVYAFGDSTGSFGSFSSVQRLADYTPGELVVVQSQYDRKNHKMNWLLDNKVVLSINHAVDGIPAIQLLRSNNIGVVGADGINPPSPTNRVKPADIPGTWAPFLLIGVPGGNLRTPTDSLGLLTVPGMLPGFGGPFVNPTNFHAGLSTSPITDTMVAANPGLYIFNIGNASIPGKGTATGTKDELKVFRTRLMKSKSGSE